MSVKTYISARFIDEILVMNIYVKKAHKLTSHNTYGRKGTRMERIISLLGNHETEVWGICAPLIIKLAKYINKRIEDQKRRKKLSCTLENDIYEMKQLRIQKCISFSKLQQGYFQYFNKYKGILSQADIEMLIRKDPATKDKIKEQLSVLIGLLEALQLKDYI